MNNETKLPDGLCAADEILSKSDYISEAVDFARDAIRAEHAQRVTLQHHAADQAQQIEDLRFAAEAGGRRIAELEAERDHAASHIASIACQLGSEALQVDDIAVRVLAVVAERDELRARLAEIEAQEPVRLTLDQIGESAETMPGGIDGFLKGWGWQQFARAIESAVLAANGLEVRRG